MLVWSQGASNALQELGLVDESNFPVSNPQSCVIVQNDLWVKPNPRLNSLFASYTSKSHNFSFEKMTFCLHYNSPSLRWSGSNGDLCNSFEQNAFFGEIFAISQLFGLRRNVYSKKVTLLLSFFRLFLILSLTTFSKTQKA